MGLRVFTRSLIASVVGGQNQEEFCARRWGEASTATILARSAVGALTSASPMSTHGAYRDEFFGRVVEQSIVGRMAERREIPFNVRTLAMTEGAIGFWVSQHNPIPLSKPTLAGSQLPRRKTAAIVVVTKEAFTSAHPATESRLDADLTAAVVATLDGAFIDVQNDGSAGDGEEIPASVTAGATIIPSSGEPGDDIANLVAAFQGDLSTSYFVTDPLTATQLALSRDAAGAFRFPDIGPRGGSIVGIPAVVSRASPRASSPNGGQIALVDAASIAVALEGVEITRSGEASIVMRDDPLSAPQVVSLFQTDSIALKVVIYGNWELQRDGGAAVVTGAVYSTSNP